MGKSKRGQLKRDLDERDRKIIRELRNNAWLTYVELGEKTNLSASAAQRRVERLIKERAIMGASAVISPDVESNELRFYVLAELRDEGREVLRSFSRRLAGLPVVVEAHYSAGEVDIILDVRTSSMEEFTEFAETHLNANSRIRRYRTLACMWRLK